MGSSETMMGDKDPTASRARAEFSAVLAEAAKRYKDSSGGESLDDFMTPPMRSLDDLKTQLALQNEHFSSFREKRDTIFSTLSLVLKPVESLGDVILGTAANVYPPTQSIFAAVTLLVGAANNVSSAYDSIVGLFNQLKDFSARLQVYVQTQMSDALRAKVVDILAALFEVFVLSTKEVRRGRFRSYLKNLVGIESPVHAALDKLNFLTLGEERQVLADAYGSVAQIQTDIKEVSQSVQSLRSEQMERTTMAHQDKLREILMPSPFPEDSFTLLNRRRVEGTGDWILMDKGFQSWLRGEIPYILICGGAGTGKSFLSTRIISWGSDNSSPFAYFYFRGGNPETRSVLQALRDVAYQLSEIDAYYGKQVLRRVHSADDIKTVSSAYRRLFLQPFEDDTRGKPLRAVLDGVDEAYPSEIQQLFAELVPDDNGRVEKGKSRVQLLLAGRSYISDTLSNHIDQSENAHLYTTVHVTPERNSSDVKAFITEGVMHSRILNRSPMELKQEIINTMERRVDGLFILARFMLEEVNRKRRANSILQSLESYPKEINGMLKQTLASLAAAITDEDAEDLNEVLTWVTCAEQALTLEQLEAVLIMRFGDPPLRFEETLRRQHSVFVELRREDGLTTDDLIKYHQDVRRKQKRDSGSGSGSRPRRSSSAGKESPRRTLSPTQKMINSARRRTSPVLFGSSPDRHFSPSRSPDLVEPDEELEFRSKASTTTVNFFHASIREFFRDEDTSAVSREAGIPTIGFDITAARTHVLMTCLRIFNDERWFQKQRLGTRRQAIRQYAAWYWQEHVEDLELDLVDKEDKRTLGKYIYNMLADEHIIYEWTILYEANDEGLEILTDAHIKVLERWLSDADVRSGLDPIAQEWAGKAVVEANGITKKIGRLYAKAWISESFDKYVPTRFCFKIVQSIAFMDEGYKWSDSMCHWTQITDKKRIEKALDWAAEPKTAHWYRRVGSTYLVSGMHAEALEHYDEALKLDKNSVETLGRKAYCLWVEKRYREALNLTLECEGIEDKIIAAAQVSEAKLKASKWRLYKDHFLIARCYYRLGEVENAMGYFQKAINSVGQAKLDASERFEPVIGYLAVLATENRHADMIRLIQELSIQPTGPKDQMSRLLDLILFVFNKPLILEWIPKSAARVGEVDFLLERLEMAVGMAHDTRDHLKVLYLRLAIAITLIYGRRIEEAFELLEKIAFTEYRPRGNVPTRQAYATSFQKLAGLYKDRALHAGVSSPQSDKWISQLEQVRQSQITHHNLDMPVNMLGSDVNVAAIYLALFHRLKGEGVQAEGLLGDLIVESCEILEDEDTQNDEYALENLLRLFVAADDLTNARALAVSMRRLNPDAQLGTPADSPVRLREGVQAVEPKLPDIQSANRSCAQCLDIIAPEEEFFICRMCIESYCRKCMTEVIKQPGNRTGESTRGDTVICRSDHEWITVPPLGVLLHRGELWLGDGQVRGFIGWKDEVKKLWSRRGASRKH